MRGMLNDRSVEALAISEGFQKPLYNTYCFSQIPQTILSLLGAGQGGLPGDCVQAGPYERVIFILIDGFGWKFLEKYRERYPFLSRFFKDGIVSKITSQFPSTTAAHLTTLCTGKPVGEHGIYEWFFYEPQVNRIVAPLLYTFAGNKTLGDLENFLPPDQFFPQASFFDILEKHNIPRRVFHHASITNSTYSRAMFHKAERIGYSSFSSGLALLKSRLQEKGLFYFYCGDFDTAAHRHGLDSPQVEKSLDYYFSTLEESFMKELNLSNTALLVAADHGMIEISPKTTYYLNRELPDLGQKLKVGADGKPLVPAGSCRDLFLHVQEKYVGEVQEELQEKLHDIAVVRKTSELMEEGFFGPVSSALRARMADLTILAKGTNSIWWYEKDRFEQRLYAMHGGLTPDEMETIFLFLSNPSC